jgi:LacI family transcriptional regulator
MVKQKSVLLILGRYLHNAHRGVARYAGKHHWHLNASMANTTVIPKGWQGDGIITALDQRADLVQFVRNAREPVVDLVLMRPEINLPRVIGDHEMIGQLAAEHFLERGLRNFAWFSHRAGNAERLRHEAFAATLARHGFTTEKLIWSEHDQDEYASWRQMRKWLGAALKALPKPIGVFAFNDYEASDFMDACLFHGYSVPEDVALLGVDNNELVCDCQAVPLSSVNHDQERIGYEAAALLERLMNGKPPPKQPMLVPPRGITQRRSTDMVALNHPEVRKALLFLRENFHRSIGTNEVAEAADLSRRGLEKAFKQQLNRSVHEEIRRLRLNHVKDLLLYSDMSVIDIAAQTGFTHAQHLNNVFHNATGWTPIRFRRIHRPGH